MHLLAYLIQQLIVNVLFVNRGKLFFTVLHIVTDLKAFFYA